ncbi:MAG TPA: molybdopterin oxidoreductase family protein [Acidimicrobiales bacterium]|nr:molybdopterin oxidoreductase family protein [Acidimicrobiales bacterium]
MPVLHDVGPAAVSRLRRRTGPLTARLRREPGAFGLGQLPSRLAPEATTTSVCGFCSTGCSLDFHLREGTAVSLTPTTAYPVNRGSACPKGWESLSPLDAPDRAVVPLWRDHAGGAGGVHPIGWEEAAATFAARFKAVMAEHGPDSVAFLSTGQIPTEEMALLGALAKFGMGFVHGDGNTRQCMATSAVAYKQSFGFDAPPYTYADLEASDVIVLVGSNLCITHPILWERVLRNRHDPEIVVVDPRATETALASTWHLPVRPKSDLTLLYGVARVLLTRGWVDRAFIDAHTADFDAFAAHVAPFTPGRAGAETGLGAEAVERLAETIHRGKRVSFWWTMGVNQSHQGTRTAQAVINLALMTGNIGRPGTGANSITGQCNAMGSRLFSNTTNLLGGRDFADPVDRRQVADALGIDPALIPDRPSLAYDRIVDGVRSGRIRALWVVATNSAHSWIDQNDLRQALGRLDFLVVQDMYTTTETARLAHLVLPAAGWGEKDGTFINSERRLGVVRRVRRAPGQALADFHIFRLLAEAWGCADLFAEWTSPEAAWQVLRRLSRGRPCDMGGIDGYETVARAGGIQWPFPDGSEAVPGEERRLFADGRFFHADGRARFIFAEPEPVAEPPSVSYPLVLLTGRGSAADWHTRTRTSKSAVLRSLSSEEPYVEISPVDAATRGIDDGGRVVVASPRGWLRARAAVTPTVGEGQVFIPMHYEATNRLTAPAFDPYSRQPSYKTGAVEVSIDVGDGDGAGAGGRRTGGGR